MTQDEITAAINAQHTAKMNAQNRLRELDYIGVKIATGRARKTDYAEQIAEMEQLAEAINACDDTLAALALEVPEDTEPEPSAQDGE